MKKIPQIVHYCWFGPKNFSELENKCIESWRKNLKNYELKLWNEETFDVSTCRFSSQAYQMKKYAFVSDYVRAKVLYEYGGIYLDTDFEILSSIEEFIEKGNFLGFETKAHLGTAIMAFQPHHDVLKEFIDYYENHPFIDEKGRIDNIANVTILSDILNPIGLKNDNSLQKIEDITIYPREYFYPKRLDLNEFRITEQTVGVHRCTNSWMTERQKKRGNSWYWINICRPFLLKCRETGMRILGKERIRSVEIIIRNLLK